MFASISALLLILFSYALIGAPIYENNSDVIMTLIASGTGLISQPDYHILFSHPLIGMFLNFLYKHGPHVPWYGIYIIGIQMFAIFAILALVSRGRTWSTSILLAWLAIIFVSLRCLHLVEFTTAASLLATAASLYLLSCLEQEKIDRTFFWDFAISLAFFILASAVRWQSSSLMLLLSGLAACAQFKTFLSKERIVRTASLFLSVAFVIAMVWCSWKYTYARDGLWAEYYPLQYSFTRIFEFGRLKDIDPAVSRAMKTIGWAPCDFQMGRSWYRIDPEVYSQEKLDKANAVLPPIDKNLRFKSVRRIFLGIVKDITVLPLLLGIGVLLICLDRRRLSLFSATSLVFSSFVVIVGIFVTMKLPATVYASVLAFLCLVLFYYSSSDRLSSLFLPRDRRFLVALPLSLGLFIFMVGYYRNLSIQGVHNVARLKANLQKIDPDPKILYLSWDDFLPISFIRPFDDVEDIFSRLNFLRIGTPHRSPITKRRLAEFGITDVLAQIDQPNIRTFSDDSLHQTIGNYMVEHYGRRPIFEPVFRDESICMWLYKASFASDPRRSDTDLNPECPGFNEGSLVLFPSAQAGDWRLLGLKLVSTDGQVSEFENKSKMPTISRYGPLNIEIDPDMYFAIEMSVNPWILVHRKIAVQLKLDSESEPKTFFIPILPDGGMHRYVYDLGDLTVPAGARITHLNILPLYTRPDPEGETFSIGRFGFLLPKGKSEESGTSK